MLWIDFKLYFYVRIHKFAKRRIFTFIVVNWFQIVFLREDSQDQHTYLPYRDSCELISNCIFTWGFTRTEISKSKFTLLWIDFKLYFYVRIHKSKRGMVPVKPVVNWFQIVFLREDSQESNECGNSRYRCELISNCIFTWGFTRLTIKVLKK